MSRTLQSVGHKSLIFVFCDANDHFIEMKENGMSVRL